jgi:hypothetical protein
MPVVAHTHTTLIMKLNSEDPYSGTQSSERAISGYYVTILRLGRSGQRRFE